MRAAFAFPAPVANVESDVGCLELFHGPTLAFKDFGGRFMAQMLTHIADDKPVTILTATSGDTGAAVAHAFYGLPNVKVVILIHEAKSVHCKKTVLYVGRQYRNCCHRRRFRCLSGAGEAGV